MSNLSILALLAIIAVASAENWVVLLSAYYGWGNYCITSTICRGYEIAAKHGIPEDHIIYTTFDTTFNHTKNPNPNHIYTRPTEEGFPEDYADCRFHIDYNKNINVDLFENIMTGDVDAIKKTHQIENPKVLKSTSEDNVFVYYMDHGSPGSCAIGDDTLRVERLMSIIKYMHDHNMYKNLVFYFEACFSGSMFQDLPKDMNVFAITGADPQHSAWMSYCPPYDVINGVSYGTCLSAHFDDAWENYAEFNSTHITHNDMYTVAHDYVATKTDQNVSKYGDFDTVGEAFLSEFIGETKTYLKSSKFTYRNTPLISVADVPVHNAKWNAIRADKKSNTNAMKELQEAVMDDLKKEVYVSRLVARTAGELHVEEAMKYTGISNQKCVNELAYQLISQCGYKMPFREEHNKALHYICDSNSMRSVSKVISDIC